MISVQAPRTAIIAPFIGDGITPGGLYVSYDEGYGAGKLAPILGRIVCCSDDFRVAKPGSVVAFRQNSPDDVPGTYGKYATIREDQIAAILEGFDEEYNVTE